MIFPQDVERAANDAKKIVGNEKSKLIFLAIVVINFFVGLWSIPFFGAMGIPAVYPVLAQLGLLIFIGVYVFRIFIYKEDEKLQESEDKTSDSFSKYYFLRNVDSSSVVKVGNKDIPVFEFDNGSNALYIRFLYGSNNDDRRVQNTKALTQIFNMFGRFGLEFSETISKEKFSESPEAKDYLNSVGQISDKELSGKMLEIVHNLISISEISSNVDVLTIRVRTLKTYQKYELAEVVMRIQTILAEHRTSFRSVSFLYKKPMLDFFRDFYGLEAIDLALMKVKDSKSALEAGRKFVEVYKLVDGNGREFTREEVLTKDIKIAKKINL